MSGTATSNGAAVKCSHCGGILKAITPRGLSPFNRCLSCGRDDRPIDTPANPTPSATATGSTKCKVDGCPGMVVSGRCACCEKRAKWADANLPKIVCEICSGVIGVAQKGNRRYCGACRPIASRVAGMKKRTAAGAKS